MLNPIFPTLDHVVAILPPRLSDNVSKLIEAHQVAEHILQDKTRESGESYLEHDRAVAYSVGDVYLDPPSMQAGLLHDTLPHSTPAQLQQLEKQFGEKVYMVLTNLKQVIPPFGLNSEADLKKAETFRRSILRPNTIQAVFVRLADRIRNLETAHKLPDESKKRALAWEARHLYAPIANRLGIWKYKSQLEDLAFYYLEPEAYQNIEQFVTQQELDTRDSLQGHMDAVRENLELAGLEGEVTGRSKHLYSIYSKMMRKNLPVEEIYDVNALRVILEPTEIRHCYEVLGMIHNMWKPIPEEFDDYIAKPKPNGYKSLHTAVYDQYGHILEVQIRTRLMHEDAEQGVGAHWIYKEEGSSVSSEFARRIEFMRQLIIDIRDESPEGTPDEEKQTNDADFRDRIYVQTPIGEIKELVIGSTPVDFAYQVHTNLGHRCRGALVNGKPAPLNTPLQEGDTVQIIKGHEARPNRDWMSEDSGYATRKNTRSKVRQWFRIHDRETNIIHGRQMLERELRLIRPKNLLAVEDVAEAFQENIDDLLAKIGFGDIQLSQVIGTLTRLREEKRRTLETAEALAAEEAQINEKVAAIVHAAPMPPQKGLTIEGLSGLHHAFANCCKPIPPEPIMGYITRGRGVTIHSKGCAQFKTQALKEPDRIVEVSWGQTNPNATYEIPLVIRAIRMPDLAQSVATIISGRRIRLVRTKSVTDKRGITTMYLVVAIHALDDLNWLKQKLENMPHVIEVQRQK